MGEIPAAAALVAIRADLLRGEFGRLASHLDRLRSAEEGLPRAGATPAELAALRDEALRVSNLLAASGAGVRAALRRLRDATSPPSTYGEDGRRTVHAAGHPPGSRA